MHQRQQRTGGRPQPHPLRIPGGLAQGSHVVHHVLADPAGTRQRGGLSHVLRLRHGGEGFEGLAVREPAHHGQGFRPAGIPQGQPDQEAVQLGLGQWEGALGFHGVLRGDDQEGAVEGIGHAALGDLPLLHALQQGGLGAGRGAVDFVRQENVGEGRPLDKGEGALLLVVHPHTGNIRRQQVGGELHPAEASVHGAGQGLRQGGLAGAGHVLQQHVAPGQQRGQRQLDLPLLAHDHPADILRDALRQRRDGCVFHNDSS